MWSHFILALSLLATFIECRTDAKNKKLKAAIKENYEAYESYEELDEYDNNSHFEESEEKKVI